ncbi:MAG: hypothetical protein R2712_09665 [Vicinamibacterales bacterium]
MTPRRARVPAVTALAVVVLLLVPTLAWLQYQWVGQVSEAEHDRMQRTLRTSALQFATAFDTELSRAVVGLQLEGTVLRDENWVSYAQRYGVDRAGGRHPRAATCCWWTWYPARWRRRSIPRTCGSGAGTTRSACSKPPHGRRS